jgi:hypothetical protein
VLAALTLTAFAASALAARRISVLQARELDLREQAHGGPLRRRSTLAAPRRWTLWLATTSVSLGAGYLLLVHDANHSSALFPTHPVDVLVCIGGLLIIGPYLCDLATGAITRRSPLATHGPRRAYEPEPNVMGALARMSPTLLFFIMLMLIECVATWLVSVEQPVKLLGGLGFVAMTTAGVLAAPTVIAAFSDEVEPAWRSRWYSAQLRAAARIRDVLRYLRLVFRAIQVVALGLVLGASAALSSDQGGALSLAFVLSILAGHGLTRMLWLWAPVEPDSEPIGAEALQQHERTMLRAAAIALAAGSVMSLAAILLA